MMCRYLLKHRERPNLLHRKTEPFFVGMTAGYRGALSAFMRARLLTFPILAALALYTVWGFGTLKRELAPLEDRSNIRVGVRAPETAGFEYTMRALDEVAFWLRDNVPEVSRTYSIGAMWGAPVNTGVQNVYLKEPAERERSQEQIFQQISRGLGGFSSLRIFPAQPPTIGDRFGGNDPIRAASAQPRAMLKSAKS